MTMKLKLAAIALTAGLIAFGGWSARGWFEDSKDLAALEAQQALADELREGQRKIASQVEQRLGELQANERIIERGVIREIQKPVYQRVCLEPDAIRLLNAAAQGKAPGESVGEVPGDSASAD
ncbi:MAG TPA: hypothetical protein VFN01_00500 [Marinobacter sp.]|uniref:hypothetical protein n=1 Tax=Marinobacter sp. TaxID=50741 RepID=UPI002D7F01FD|nr:hypothetical protein [Marinobacter sp.]HET8799637.1 hypothetical protein [Marinobacter sp.]